MVSIVEGVYHYLLKDSFIWLLHWVNLTLCCISRSPIRLRLFHLNFDLNQTLFLGWTTLTLRNTRIRNSLLRWLSLLNYLFLTSYKTVIIRLYKADILHISSRCNHPCTRLGYKLSQLSHLGGREWLLTISLFHGKWLHTVDHVAYLRCHSPSL